MLYGGGSPLSSPRSANDPNPINLSQPMSAPHNQLRYPSNQRNPSSSSHPTPDSSINHHRMSEPALLSGSHPSTYRPVDSCCNYTSSSAYSPPSLHYLGPPLPAYTVHSRIDSNASLRITVLSKPTMTPSPILQTTALDPPLDLQESPIPPLRFIPSLLTRRCHQTSRLRL